MRLENTLFINAEEERELLVTQLQNGEKYPATEGVFYTSYNDTDGVTGWYCIRVEEGGRDIQVRVMVLNGKLVSARKLTFPAESRLPSAEDLDRTVDGESPLVPIVVPANQE